MYALEGSEMSPLHESLITCYQSIINRYPHESEFHQSVHEVFQTIDVVVQRSPHYLDAKIPELLCIPERQILFRVPWLDDQNRPQINQGYRVEFNSALGPYKGGLRLHPSVNLSIIKFLGFEQTFKNALTGIGIGGGKGGSDFDPKGRSASEILRFCQSYMTELYRHIGQQTDIPAGDIGVGQREIGYLFGQYRRITNRWEAGVITGKGTAWGGSHVRQQATGYGVVFFLQEALRKKQDDIEGKRCVVSGSGNVALYTIEKLQQFGGHCVACSDSDGVLYHPDGLDLALLKEIKFTNRERLAVYCQHHRDAKLLPAGSLWSLPCDLAIPAATQNELTLSDAKALISNGCQAVAEGANMPTTPEAITCLTQGGVLFLPGKAANAGGVITSGLEMRQNAQRTQWSFAETEQQLALCMQDVHTLCYDTAEAFGHPGNYTIGANCAGFIRVADAMLAQGLI